MHTQTAQSPLSGFRKQRVDKVVIKIFEGDRKEFCNLKSQNNDSFYQSTLCTCMYLNIKRT